MPRRNRPAKRVIVPDSKYQSVLVAQLINRVMTRGKKSLAQRIVYDAMDIMAARTKKPALDILQTAVKNATPIVEVKPRRVGGATYQVPVEVRSDRRLSLALRWLVGFARQRSGKTMAERLAAELLDASNGVGATIKKREDTHRMAEANKAFSHYRW